MNLRFIWSSQLGSVPTEFATLCTCGDARIASDSSLAQSTSDQSISSSSAMPPEAAPSPPFSPSLSSSSSSSFSASVPAEKLSDSPRLPANCWALSRDSLLSEP